jgi:hypothetical protein
LVHVVVFPAPCCAQVPSIAITSTQHHIIPTKFSSAFTPSGSKPTSESHDTDLNPDSH